MTFSVETETLRALAVDLDSVDSTLQGLAGVVQGFAGQLGSSAVESALDKFVGNWSQGVSMVTNRASGLQQVAAGAANNYDESDTSIAQAARGQ
jgi:hypothetical protein